MLLDETESLVDDAGRFRALAEHAAEAIITIDAEDRIIFANRAAERVFGYSGDDLLRLSFTQLIPERHRAAHRRGIARHVRTGEKRISWEGIELPGLRRDGSEVPLEVTFGEYSAGGQLYFTGIMRDITERQRAEEERAQLLERERAARAEAEAANRAKSAFLANMSHEIRTPINAIMGYSDLLDAGIPGPLNETQADYLKRIGASSRHLLTLVNDILDLAKVEAGHLSVVQEPALVVTAVAGATALVVQEAQRRHIEIRDECTGAADLTYLGDEDRVRQIMANLLSNAVKFTEPGGRITIRCTVTDERVPSSALKDGPWTRLEVEDTGSGIAPADQQRIFSPFVQTDEGLTRSQGGSGLGLSISRELARLMDGDLTVESTPGSGSTFMLWLPHVSAVAPDPDEVVIREARSADGRAGLGTVGLTLQQELSEILAGHVSRLRADPLIPVSHAMDQADIEDHTGTFLTDIAQALVALEHSESEPVQLMKDGTKIQRVISELHGAQRARLGWTEEALRREWNALREELERVLRDRLGAQEDVDLDFALDTLSKLMAYAEQNSRRGMGRALGPADSQ